MGDASIQGAAEGELLVSNQIDHPLRAGPKLGKGLAETFDHRRNQVAEEGFAHAEGLVTVTRGPSQDAAEDVRPTLVSRGGAVGDGHGEAADVVGDHPVGDVRVTGQRAAVGRGPGAGGDGREDRRPEVGVVVAPPVLKHRDQALEAHAGVDVAGGQELQGPAGLAVELDEDVIPDLEDVGVAGVDQRGGVAPADPVEVDLRTGAARPGVTHLPEVVLHVPGDDMGGGKEVEPYVASFLIGVETGFGLAPEVGHVDPVGRQTEDGGQELPAPGDRVDLEVVAERPRSQHLEEGVVIGVAPDILEIVVLSAGADALLAVHGPGVRTGSAAQKDILELVHACVGEEQRRVVVRDHRGGWHVAVAAPADEEVEKLTASFGGEHGPGV